MKNKWRNYAIKDGKVQESYLRKHRDRSEGRQAAEASGSNSLLESGKIQQEVGSHERSREEKPFETHQQGQQGIQVPVERGSSSKEENTGQQAKRKKVMKKEKETEKHKKHEATETKAYEKKEDKKEKKEKK